MTLAPGARLGAYEIISMLGAGGMGEVYLAHDPRLGRDVAIKVLPPAFASDAQRLRRFEQEARAVAALDHPNILAIHDIGRHNDAPYIVMEYVRGETLAVYLRRGRLPCARALEIGSEIAAALAVAHNRRLVHRDLKPGNVMMTPDGHVKVLDFGLATSIALENVTTTLNGSALDIGGTLAGQVLGTPGYMSPEQLLGLPVDHRTDIYSLGVILFELVTGQRPFGNVALDALRHAAMNGPLRLAREADPTVPAAVSDVIARAMSKDPSERPQSAGALKTELRRLMGAADAQRAGGAPLSEDETRSRSVMAGRQRAVRYAAWSLVAALALAGAMIPIWRASSRKSDFPAGRPVIAVLPLTNLSGDASKAYLGVGIADTLTTSLGQLSSVSVVSHQTMRDAGDAKTTDLAKIARDLGATMLVQGSMQQSGDRVRVNATLVTPDGRVMWSGDSEAGLSDLFSLENRLAGSLVDALRVTVSGDERQRLARPPTSNRDALDAYWQGLAFLDRADDASLDQAISSFQHAVALDAQFSLAHAGLGEAYRRKSEATTSAALMTSAVKEVSEALRIDPDQPEVHLSLANVYRSTGRKGAAVDELKRALAEQPNNDDAHRQLGDLLASEGGAEEALNELQHAVNLRPLYWRNHQSLGIFYLRTGKLNDAIVTFTRLTELKPDDVSPYQQLGAAYQMKGDTARARQNYERSISIHPNPGAYANLGLIHYSEGHYEEAARAYEEALRLAPNRALYQHNLADAYMKTGRTAAARAAYEKAAQLAEAALSVNASDATTLSQLGLYQAKLGRRRDAERNATAAVGINPTSADAVYMLGVVLALNGEKDAALKRISEAISRGYSKQLVLKDEDLSSLRSLPAFQALVAPAK